MGNWLNMWSASITARRMKLSKSVKADTASTTKAQIMYERDNELQMQEEVDDEMKIWVGLNTHQTSNDVCYVGFLTYATALTKRGSWIRQKFGSLLNGKPRNIRRFFHILWNIWWKAHAAQNHVEGHLDSINSEQHKPSCRSLMVLNIPSHVSRRSKEENVR